MTRGDWDAGGGTPPYPDPPRWGGGLDTQPEGGWQPPPPPGPYGPEQSAAYGLQQRYKGAQYGLPWSGPGSLAGQWNRLLARILDGIFLLPWTVGLYIVMSVAFNIHLFSTDKTYDYGTGMETTHSHIAVGAFFLYSLISLLGVVIYESVFTGMFGRTPGKSITNIRIAPVANPKQCVGGKLAALRYVYYAAPQAIVGIGLLWTLIDTIWCLFDSGRQCLHDKLAKTIVINWPSEAG